MEPSITLTDKDIEKQEPVILVSPKNPSPTETCFLSNIDQTLAFPVGTVFFFEIEPSMKTSTFDIADRVKKAVAEVLLIPYYFIAGRLNFNTESNRLELVCNNAGVPFVTATSELSIIDLGDYRLPNTSYRHLIHPAGRSNDYANNPVFTMQITRFKCGGYTVGYVLNHSLFDGRTSAEMFLNLAAICRGETPKMNLINTDRRCIQARTPPQIKFPHKEYIMLSDIPSNASSFVPPSSALPEIQTHTCKLFCFTPEMVKTLKDKAMTTKCSTFEVMVAHLWRTRTKAVFNNPNDDSSVMFAVDIRSKIVPPLPDGFAGNAVLTASATAKVAELTEKHFSFCVEKIKQAIEMIDDEYLRSAIDWLEVYRGVPRTSLSGNFYVSAWWKLPFHGLDFGHGKPIYGGPIVAGYDDFVLLLSDGKCNLGGINVWIGLEPEKMDRFINNVYEI